MKKILLLALSAALLMPMWSCSDDDKAADYASYVNLKIGTGGHGHVFVGANVPFGMVQLGPTSIPQEWDWCSGYHDSDNSVIGFSHTHLSGTGIGDLFDITVMPVTGEVVYARGVSEDPASGLWSPADRSKEVAEPGYYSVPLTRYGITAELTATSRVGFHRYTFPASEDAAIIFDLENGGCWDSVYDSSIIPVENEKGDIIGVEGYRYSSGWARDQKVFFHAEFSRPIASFSEEVKTYGNEFVRKASYGRCNLGKTAEGEQILVKVAISPVSVEGAVKNMNAEVPAFDFELAKSQAREAWNKALGVISIETDDADARTVFYTALFHTMVAPSEFSDVDGQYRGSDGKVRQGDFKSYTTFSLWDTYRAQMPLMTIIHPDMMDDMVKTMYHIYEEQGDLPVWHLWGNETDCMVGNPGLISFADAIIKGFGKDISPEDAIKAMVATAVMPDRGQDLRMKYGYIPCDIYKESVANDMEYAIADAALANAAEYIGNKEVADIFRERSHSYRYFFDPETGFMRGRTTDGKWSEPFDPIYSRHGTSDYCEGTGWQYLWLVPQDVNDLAELLGGREAAVKKLDGLFTAPDHVEGENASPDISGLIGQYAHGNEPGHHTIYLYTMLGEPAKAADRIHQVYKEMYFNDVEGLAGNEDVGQMSAWFVLSSLGFYEVEPASTRFWFGAPRFQKATVKVAGGEFVVTAEGLSDANPYIQSITLNGQAYNKPYIEYKDIVSGGNLVYKMGPNPAKWF